MRTLCLLVLLGCVGCLGNDRAVDPKSYHELEAALRKAINASDYEAVASLFYDGPNWQKDSRPFIESLLTDLQRVDYAISRTEYLGGEQEKTVGWVPPAEAYIAVTGRDGNRMYSMAFAAAISEGKAVLCSPGKNRNTWQGDRSLKIWLVRGEGPLVLGERKATSFANAWDGHSFTSYSMDNLARTLSERMGVETVNRTSIEGEYDFAVRFYDLQRPSQVKLDLQSVGLTLRASNGVIP